MRRTDRCTDQLTDRPTDQSETDQQELVDALNPLKYFTPFKSLCDGHTYVQWLKELGTTQLKIMIQPVNPFNPSSNQSTIGLVKVE